MVTGLTRSFNSIGRPTQTSIDLMNSLKEFLDPLLAKFKEISNKDIPELNRILAESGVPYIK